MYCVDSYCTTWLALLVKNGFVLKDNNKDQWFMTKVKKKLKCIAAVEYKNEKFILVVEMTSTATIKMTKVVSI